jgi:hypothetical protein
MARAIHSLPIDVIDDDLAEILRQKSPTQRIQMAAEANDTARILAAGGVRYLHPDWADDRVRQEVARRMLNAAD